jgi:hypothetical protein
MRKAFRRISFAGLLVRYFGPVSIGKGKKKLKIFIFIGRYREELDATGATPSSTSS